MSCNKNDCVNQDIKCHICVPEGRLYSTGKKPKVKKEKKKNLLGKVKKYQKQGMKFQDKVENTYNKKMAKQQPNSGAIWHMPGDIITEKELMECKERNTINSKGEKQITIKKLMLDKIKEEAGFNRVGILPFRFKGNDDIYLIADFDVWLELIHQNNELKNKIKKLEQGEDK